MTSSRNHKIILISVISFVVILLCGVAIYFTTRKGKKQKTGKKENKYLASIPKSKEKEEKPVPQTIKEMEPEIRVKYGQGHDTLFEKDKVEQIMGFIKFPTNWLVKPMPPRNNFLQHLQITDDLNKMPVTIQFDAHGIHTNNDEPGWQVSQNGKRIEVYGSNTKELITAIEQMLETAPPAVHTV